MKLVLLLVIAAAACFAQTFPVAGVVIDSQTGKPVNRVHVVLAAGNAQEQSMVTGEDGRFSFQIRKGRYGLMAERRGTRLGFGNESPTSGFNSSIVAGPDQDTSHLVFKWFAPASVFGRVIDDRGDPVENATIQMIREAVTGGVKRITTYTSTRTDDRGNYRIGPVQAGTYYLVASGEPWRSQFTPLLNQGRNMIAPPQVLTYPPVYFPNATDPRGAAAVKIDPGAEIHADFAMHSVIGANLHPICHDASPDFSDSPNISVPARRGQPPVPEGRCNGGIALYLQGVGGTETFVNTTFTPGANVVSGIPPGRYTLRYNMGGNAMRKVIDVGGGDVTVDLAGFPPPSISGTVTFKNPGFKPRTQINLRLLNEVTGSSFAHEFLSDGSLSWKNVPVGKYRPLIGSTEGLYPVSITARGAELQNGVLDLAEGMNVNLQIVASDDVGRLNGFVKNGDKGVPGAILVLAPRVPRGDPTWYRGFQTEHDGSFDFANVRTGEYVLVPLDRTDVEWTNPEVLKPYLPFGKPVTIAPHATVTENIDVSGAAPT